MKQPLAVRQFSDNGINHETRFWPKGAALADAGWRLAKEEIMDPLKAVEGLATKHGGLEAAMATDEGAKLYSEYRESLVNGQRQAPVEQPAPTDTRNFLGSEKAAVEVRAHESGIEARVTSLLASEGKFTPTSQERAEAMSRLVAAEPQLYNEYQASLRRATGRS